MSDQKKRPFRSKESYEAEAKTRGMVSGFLQGRGYLVKADLAERNGQTIAAVSPSGEALRIRVRLCWRSDEKKADSSRTYSAAQLLPRIKDGDWIGTLKEKVEREQAGGITHYLFVQRIGDAIRHAALVPSSELVSIWTKQRDKSNALITAGKLGSVTKNHAENGSSPTIWLQDDPDATEVAEQLWSHPGVIDLMSAASVGDETLLPEEVPGPEAIFEGALRRITVNAYERDSKARKCCIETHKARCACCDFDFGLTYGPEAAGYIHVHHKKPLSEIGREYQVDPVSDLIPVCPNCHSVIHLGGKCRTVDEVKAMLTQATLSKT